MQTTTPTIYYIIAAIVIIAIVIAVAAGSRRARSARLQRRFGPEYERTVSQAGSREAAERELAQRESRVKKFHIQELAPGAKQRYSDEWRAVQARFVDEPRATVGEADRLVSSVMRDRGYPMDDFDQRVADLSADHPLVVENYRAAHAIAGRSESQEASTEDLRQAMVHYRMLFDDLLGTTERTTP